MELNSQETPLLPENKEKIKKIMIDLLGLMVEKNASDLFVTAGFPPAIKVDGKLIALGKNKITADVARNIARVIMTGKQAIEFENTKECNFSIGIPNASRFRVNAFVQRGSVGLVFRTIATKIPTIAEMGLPEILKNIAMSKRGLVIFVGATGAGKSTSLAAMVDHRNENSDGHIITLEDPIEFMHEHKQCVVTQREVGVDTDNWEIALKNAFRQAPDVILIGEIRDKDAMEYAIALAETGHLCMATLHANNTNQALDRIINFFPEDRRQQLLMDLSLNTRAFVSQRLIPNKSGVGRVAAFEVMINSPLISDLIFKGEVREIKEIIAKSREIGMQTFDQSLFDLYEADLITYEDALRNADSVNDLRLKVKLDSKKAHESMNTSENLKDLNII